MDKVIRLGRIKSRIIKEMLMAFANHKLTFKGIAPFVVS